MVNQKMQNGANQEMQNRLNQDIQDISFYIFIYISHIRSSITNFTIVFFIYIGSVTESRRHNH